MNKKIAAQIEGHQQRIKDICDARITYLNEWIREHSNADYGTRYDNKVDEYRKEVKILQRIMDERTVADYERELYNDKLRISELESLLRNCHDKMNGYGDFEVIQRMIRQTVNMKSVI